MRRYSVLIVGVLVAATCIRLGFWQLSRLRQRHALRVMVESRGQQPPLDALALTASRATPRERLDSAAYRRASVRGVFDFSRQVVVVARTVTEIPAVYLATPLRLPGGEAILVERGWVPSPDAYTVALDALEEPRSALVTGVLLRVQARRALTVPDPSWPLRVPSDDPDQLAARYPYPLLPWVLRRAAPDSAPPVLRPIPLPVIDNGPHLSYAIQWFAFAVIALTGPLALYWRDSRESGGRRVGARSDG